MKHTRLILFFSFLALTCSKDESVDLIPQNAYNPEITVMVKTFCHDKNILA